MIYISQIRYKGPVPGYGLKMRDWNEIQREAGKEIAVTWHATHMQRHFTNSGAIQYGYKERTKKYRERKQKEHGHSLPLVWSGESRARARIAKVRSTAVRGYFTAKLSMNTPRLNLRRSPKSPDMARELRIVSEPEFNRLVTVANMHIEKRLRDQKRVYKFANRFHGGMAAMTGA